MKSELIIDKSGDKLWKLPNGKLHRENGPAVLDIKGGKSWHLNGKLHRGDGSAIEYSDGRKLWFLNDIQYSEKEYKYEMRLIKLEHIL